MRARPARPASSTVSALAPKPMTSLDRIRFDPQVLGGKATVRGLRMSVAQIVNMVANGMSAGEILREYPFLEEEDIRQALRYAALLANEEIHPVTAASG